MEIMNSFTFNGKSSADFGLLVSNVSNYGAPSRVVEKIQVPYRNGDLLIDSGAYNNYIVSYQVSIITNTVANMRAIAEWLLAPKGYALLTDTYNSGEFRQAAYYDQLDYTMAHLNRYGRATISFDCKPQRYLDSGTSATTITNGSHTFSNPTGFDSKPLLVIAGNGTATVNGVLITVADNSGDTITIDCETMQCYRGTTNMNSSVIMDDFPVLSPGNNTVTLGTATSIKVTPRWWRL